MTGKPRILEFCLSPSQGGLELYVVKITRQLRALGYPVESMTRTNTFLSASLAGKYNTGIDYRSFFGTFVAAKRTARYLDSRQIDVVHIHWGNDLLHAVLAKKWARRPLYLIYSRQMRISRTKHDPYHSFLYKGVDILTVITAKLLEEARLNLPMEVEKLRLLRYGITPARQVIDCNKFLEAVDFDEGRYTIGCFSRREQAKGQHVLINALRRLDAQGVDFQAIFIGHVMDQAYEQRLHSMVNAFGLESRVRFLDFIDDPLGSMACFEVIVLPTYEETFGLVLAEAMSMGIAVMGTNAGGVPEIIEHEVSGLLFAPDEDEELARGLNRLYSDPKLRSAFARRGQQVAKEKYSDEAHLEVLNRILHERSAH